MQAVGSVLEQVEQGAMQGLWQTLFELRIHPAVHMVQVVVESHIWQPVTHCTQRLLALSMYPGKQSTQVVRVAALQTPQPAMQGAQPEAVMANPLRQSWQVRVWLPLVAVVSTELAQFSTTVPNELKTLLEALTQELLLVVRTYPIWQAVHWVATPPEQAVQGEVHWAQVLELVR